MNIASQKREITNGVAVGQILRIEKSSIHDGEGLRSVVFFKGCSMRCAWCSTPESQNFELEIGIDRSKCVRCGACVSACPHSALSLREDVLHLDRCCCTGCFKCAAACPKRAIKKYGTSVSVREIADEVSKDDVFYFHSGGGVTLSGGEPCSQPDYAAALLKQLRANGVHTTMESALFAPWENVEAILPYLDALFVDLKHMDPIEHERWTGVDNKLILENLRKVDRCGHPLPVTIRTPLIPGVNDGDANLRELARFTHELPNKLKAIELLPYHRLGLATYRMLDKDYSLDDTPVQPWDWLSGRAQFLSSCKPTVPVFAGGVVFQPER